MDIVRNPDGTLVVPVEHEQPDVNEDSAETSSKARRQRGPMRWRTRGCSTRAKADTTWLSPNGTFSRTLIGPQSSRRPSAANKR